MRYFIYILLYLKILFISADNVAYLSCEYSDTDWQALDIDQLYTCDILTDTIDSPNYKIKYEASETEKVEGLRFLDNKNVKFLPNNIGEIFPNLKALAVSGTYLNKLNSNDLKGLTQLRYATFANSDLNVIEDGTFKDLSALEELDFRDSNIRIIEEDAFHGMTSLKTLYLSGNKLNSLEPKTFDGLESLQSLSLELNHLEYIDENLFATNGNLEDIWLNKNKIIGLPYKVFEKIPKLAYVDLQENICIDYVYDPSNFDELKDDCEKCTAIPPPKEMPEEVNESIELVIEQKPHETFRNEYNIDGDIDTGVYRQSIKINESLDEIDESIISNDASSKIVECQTSQIHWKLSNAELPTCVIENQIIDSKDFNIADSADGNSMKAMSFAQNKYIKYLPQNIASYAPHLEEFSARNASLRIISKNNFAGLKHLKSLNLADNRIKFIDPDAFDDLTSLEELDLSGNELSTLDSELFRKLKNLKTLRIGGNQIHSLPSNLFQNLRNLVNISISHQHISDINANTFKSNTKLKNIWMNSNKLKSLSPNMFTSKLKDLEYVDMRDNKCIDGFYDQAHFQQMKAEVLEKCGKKYVVYKSTKVEDQKKKGKGPKKDSKKGKIPKIETVKKDDLDEKEVICDYEEVFWSHLNKTLKTCVISESIDNPDYLISANPLLGDYVNADTIEAISFKNNKNAKYLPKNLFNIFPNLVEFSAENAGLTKINPQDFKGLKKLKSLNLSKNGLKSIDRESFKDLTSLEELILDDNDIEELDEETFTFIKRLRKLRTKGNRIKTVHNTWFEDMPDLEEVSFTFSEPIVFQKEIFRNNHNLKDIDWNGAHYDGNLNEVDSDFYSEVVNKKELSCSYEEVTDPDTDETFTLCKIDDNEVIDDSDYTIKSSPQNNKVRKFVMNNNQNIKFLPRNLGKTFPMLEDIDVDNTALDVIDRESFHNLPHLKTLKMARNKVSNFDSDTFDDLPQLEVLDLSENELEVIKDGSFYKLKNLRNLKLDKNKLHKLDPKIFKEMKFLKKFSIPGNKIEFLDRHIFKHNPNIEEIDLSDNDIDSLNPRTFEKLKKLKWILFKGNKCLDDEYDSTQLSDLKNDISKNCKMLTNLKEVSCEHQDVNEIESDVVDITTCVVDEDVEIDEPGYKFTIDTSVVDPSHIRTLSMSNNPKIKFLPENIGQMFPNLENVMIQNTSIEDIPDETFIDMDNVKFVDLSRNKIKRLNPNSFTGLRAINKINLGDNEFEEMDHVPFTKIPSISAVDLRGNKLKPGTKNMLVKNLPDIDFEGIEEIEDSVEVDKEVECDEIEQDHSKGTYVCTINSQIDSPDYVLDIPEKANINSFTLIGNDDVQYIPKNLHKKFPNVKNLKFYKTGIKEVPQAIKSFNDLETLDLSNNKIKSLKPLDFRNMPKLKKLQLNGNIIEDIDESTFDLPSLESIDLSGNRISSIPHKTFHKLKKLNWITLEDNDDSLIVDEKLFEPIDNKNIQITYTKKGEKKTFEVNADIEDEEEIDSSEEEYEEVTEVQIIRRKTTKKTRKRPQEKDVIEEQYTDTTEYFFTNEVTCDWANDDEFHICIINGQPIRNKGFRIKSTPNDSDVDGLLIEDNEEVQFLPENIGEVFPNLQKLTVRNTSVSEIPGDILRKMHKLKTLELPNNNLSELDPEMFTDSPILEEINLSGNKIKKLPDDIFKFVPDLKYVELDNNEITDLDPKIFESVPNLTKLSIEGNNIPVELSEDMFTSNPFLKISKSKTTTTKPSTKELECDVGWRRIESGSDSSVSNREYDDEDNILTCILEDQSILDEDYTIKSTSKDPKIKSVVIENSPNVKFVPENIGDLFPNLETLSIKNTSISKIPNKTMKKLRKLKSLSLPNNKISELDPEMLDVMPSLEELDFSGNNIEMIPKTLFKKVPKLKIINFENNEITELEPDIFESLPHLTEITIDGDDLPDETIQTLKKKHPRLKIKSSVKTTTTKSITDAEEIECDTEYIEWTSIDEDSDDFVNMLTCVIKDQDIKKGGSKIKPTSNDKEIRGFKMDNNKDVDFIPENIGDLFPNLQKISVQNTSIKELPKELLNNANNLNLLDLSNNKIKELDPETFNNLPQLEEIDLSGNDFKEIPNDIFEDLPELKVIDLSDNNIDKLDPELFKNVPKLRKLIIEDNNIPDEAIVELIKEIPSVNIPTFKTTNKSTTTTIESESEHAKEVKCDTEYSEFTSVDNSELSTVFTCVIKEQEIVDPDFKIKPTPFDSYIQGIKIENNKDVKFIPENIGQLFPNLEKMSIQNTSVSKIPKEALENLDNLKVLDISNNEFKEIDPEMFNKLPQLEEIDLSGNQIQEIPENLFDKLPELKVVDLDDNEITNLDPKLFENSPKLTKLTVDGNDLPDEVTEELIKNIANIKYPINKLTTTTSSLSSSSTIKPSSTTKTTTTIKSVTETSEPKKVTCNTDYSEWVSLENGDLSTIVTCIIKDQEISDPDFKIKPTPYDSHIHGIKIENNKDVKFIPDNIGQLFPNLQKISIQNTSVSKIPNKVLENLDNLKVLDLSNNNIKELDPEIFNNVPLLEEVDLSGNEIKELPDDLFKNVPELKAVDLADNKITKLDPEIFESTPHLKKLVIKGNDLPKDLNKDSFVYNPMVEIVETTTNPTLEGVTEELLKEIITQAPVVVTTEIVTEKSTQSPKTKPVDTGNKGTSPKTQETTTKKSTVGRTTSRLTTKTPTTTRPKVPTRSATTKSSIGSSGSSGVRQTTTTTQRPRTKPQILSTRAPTTTTKSPFKTVKCGIIYETAEPGSKNAVKCDMTDQTIEDPEVSLANIPNGKEIEVLKLDNNKNIKYLPDNIGDVFPNLKEITAKNAAIDSILPGDFEDLRKLENVVLSGNDLKSIEPETFDGLDNLKNLDLSNNQIEFIDEDAFGRLPSLKNLNLDNNEITFIHPNTFRNMPKLETLEIEGNNIPSLSDKIFQMNPQLKEVKHSIPSFVLTTTTTLRPSVTIHTTFIKPSTTTRPKTLSTTTRRAIDTRPTTTPRRNGASPFKEVECDYANIQWDFSDDVLFSCDLKDAVIDDTNYVIKQSPKNKRVKGLSFVDSKNVKFLPQNIDKVFPNLVEISTFNSSIKHIPKDALKNLPKLRGLSLMSSGISTIAPKSFDELPAVEFIELSDNNIKDLHPDLFKKTPALRYLYLNDNNLKNLDPTIFENLPELRNISLEGNDIPEVNKKLFKNNYELQNVWLNGNKIKAIDPTIFDGKRALEYVDLRGNDCIDKFYEGYNIEGIRNSLRNKCKTPEEAPTEEVVSTTRKSITEEVTRTTTRPAKQSTQKTTPESLNPYPTRKPPYSFDNNQRTTTVESQTIPSSNYRTTTLRYYTESPIESPTIPSYNLKTTSSKPITDTPISVPNYRTSTRRSPSSATERPTKPPQHFIGTTEVITKRPKIIKCSLNYHEFPGTRPEIYTCFISDQSIDDPEYVIQSTPHDEYVNGISIDDNKNVKFLPQNIGEIFPNLKHLSAKHNSIENVPSLNNMENVKTLELSDNGLKIIDPEVLKKLPLLEELNLSGNQIPLFINGTFDNLPNLKTLDISRNNIGELSPDIFNKLPELQKVSLDNNELTELPEKIFKTNPKLQVVNLNGNKINKISPVTFENLPNLGEVNLGENPCINGVYKSGAFYAMKSDMIRGCAPDNYIPQSVEEVVDTTTSTMRSIEKSKPSAIECNYGDTYSSTSEGYLPTCLINENKVIDDPEWEIKEMPANRRIKRFMIFDNDKIEKLPNNLGETFPDLNDIIVTGAPIKSISPKDFKDMNNLKSIAITGSSIKVLDPETFKGAPLLEDLDLSSNNLRHIDDGAFEGIKRLKNLDLSGNKIPKISNNVLKPLTELKTLKLTGNDLQNIDNDIFKGNPKLYKVNLDENNLRSIDPDAFDRMPHLIDINLSKNDCIDRSFSASNMHMMRKILNENCQPYEALRNELKTCKKEIENCISKPRQNDAREMENLKDTIKKSDIKIKQLNIQLNKLRNALNAEKLMLRRQVEKSKNLETELDVMKMKCARVDENHNMLIDINCNYNELNNGQYSCNAQDLIVKTENSTIENPIGIHKRGKRDTDVNSLIISNQDVKFIPNGISNHFPQLNELTVENSGLVKINQAPLKHLPHLNKLVIRGNDIYHIEPNALKDIPQLDHLDLSQNNIMDIPINLFDEMPKLKILNLNDNALLSLPQNIIPNVNSLKTFTVGNNNLNFIDPRIFKRLDTVGVVDFTNNKCIDKKFDENDDDYMSFVGIVSIKCTNDVDDSGKDGFCTGRKI